jgi:hypothetical protein
MRFIVANYGERHVGMLLAHLHSVTSSHPAARVTVYWQDVSDHLMVALRAISPAVEFRQTRFDFDRDPLQRISSKVLCWERAAAEYATEPRLVFCDSDTLVRCPLAPFFERPDFDVLITTKPERVPLNSGVMLARGGERAHAFFRRWREETMRILETPASFAQANDPSEPYGGTDQMSLYQMLPYVDGSTSYTVDCGGVSVCVATERCSRLNETNSRPLTPDVAVVHYKGGWQRILLDGRPFSRFRKREASWEMLTYFLETLESAVRSVNATTGLLYSTAEFGIRWPWYYQRGEFNAPAYAVWRVKEAAKRAWLLASGKLKPGM